MKEGQQQQEQQQCDTILEEGLNCSSWGGDEREGIVVRRRNNNNNDMEISRTSDNNVEKPRPIRMSTKNVSTSSSVSTPLSVISKLYDLDGDGKLNETEKQLRQMHTTTTTNGHNREGNIGGLDIHKVYNLLEQQRELNTRVFNLKKFTFCLVLLVIILSVANLGTAFVAVRLAKDTEIDHSGVLIDKNSHNVIQTDSVVRQVQATVPTQHQQGRRQARRRNQQQSSTASAAFSASATTSTATIISKQEAANLFDYCSQGSAIMDILIPPTTDADAAEGQEDNANSSNEGHHQILTVCPADSYSQYGDNDYVFIRGDKDLQIHCSSSSSDNTTTNNNGDDSNDDDEEDQNCSMSGSMLLFLQQQPSSSSSSLIGGGQKDNDNDNVDLYTIPSYQQILYAAYEDGTLNSSIQQLTIAQASSTETATTATSAQLTHAAADSDSDSSVVVYLANFGAHQSNHSICHKVSLDDTTSATSSSTTKSGGSTSSSSMLLSSQSDTMNILATRYTPGSEYIYKFSFLLVDWQPYDYETMAGEWSPPMDILWQFQHTLGEPDAMLGIRRNSLYIRYGKSTSRFRSEALIIDDLITKHPNEWIDIEIHIKWAYDFDDGFIRLRVGGGSDRNGTPQEPNNNNNNNHSIDDDMVFQVENYKTFTDNGDGDYGYIKWGLDRPLSNKENTPSSMYERIVCHDDIEITSVTYS